MSASAGVRPALPNQCDRREDLLVGLRPVGLPGERDERHTVPVDRLGVHAWVTGGWRADELVELHAVGPGEGQQQQQGGHALPGLQARQGLTEMPVATASWARVARCC